MQDQGNSPDDFARALRDKPMDPQKTYGLGGDKGNGMARALGLLFLVAGAGVLWGLFMTLDTARSGLATELDYWSKSTVLSPALLAFGVALLIGGSRVMLWWVEGQRRVAVVGAFLVFFAMGIALDRWMLAELAALGFTR